VLPVSPTSIEFQLDGIAHLIADRTLAVPVYQRSYAWGREEVSEFWSDLKRALDEGYAEYFMGTVVNAGQNGASTVIDGQQRLATTTILIAALRDAYQLRGDIDRAKGLHEQYLARFDLASAKSMPRLTLNAEDREFFSQAIVEGLAPEAEISSHERLLEAQTILHQRVEEDLSSINDGWSERILAWVDLLHTKVKVVVIDVPDIADGFVIFETLNDRGAPLTISDLVRNYLMSRGEDNSGVAVVQDAWTDALLQLGMQDEDNVFVDYLRQFWSSRYGAVREKDLLRAIRAALPDRESSLSFARLLPDAARHYAALLDAKHELWAEYSPSARGSVEALIRLDLKQYRPLALALLDVFDEPELARTLRALVSWTVRGLVTGGIGGGAAERAYGVAATKVRSGELVSADLVLRQLIPIVPNDSDFEASFTRARIPRTHVARYLLTALEREARGHADPELVSDDFGVGLRLYYVLPKGADSDDWPDIDDDAVKSLVPRLGNGVLLSEQDPDLAGARTFTERRRIFSESNVTLTRELAASEIWSESAIDERQQQLARRALTVWPRSPTA
jgi:hypothetical protein